MYLFELHCDNHSSFIVLMCEGGKIVIQNLNYKSEFQYFEFPTDLEQVIKDEEQKNKDRGITVEGMVGLFLNDYYANQYYLKIQNNLYKFIMILSKQTLTIEKISNFDNLFVDLFKQPGDIGNYWTDVQFLDPNMDYGFIYMSNSSFPDNAYFNFYKYSRFDESQETVNSQNVKTRQDTIRESDDFIMWRNYQINNNETEKKNNEQRLAQLYFFDDNSLLSSIELYRKYEPNNMIYIKEIRKLDFINADHFTLPRTFKLQTDKDGNFVALSFPEENLIAIYDLISQKKVLELSGQEVDQIGATVLNIGNFRYFENVFEQKQKKFQYFLLWYDGKSICVKGRKFINIAAFVREGEGEWKKFVKEKIIISDDGSNKDIPAEDTFDNIFGKKFFFTQLS